MLTKTTVRFAKDEDGIAIRDLLNLNDCLTEGLDWLEISPYWLVAEHRGQIIGCIQVLPGLPTGFIDQWVVNPEYVGSGVGMSLLYAAEESLTARGCNGYVAHIENEVLLSNMERFGACKLGNGFTVIFRRIKQ